jgi:hypothetical protein
MFPTLVVAISGLVGRYPKQLHNDMMHAQLPDHVRLGVEIIRGGSMIVSVMWQRFTA